MAGSLGREMALPLVITAPGVYYFEPQDISRYEWCAIQWQVKNCSSNFAGTIGFDLITFFNTSWAPFQISGSNYASTISVAGGFIQGSVGKLTFRSVSANTSGNEIYVTTSSGGTAGVEVVTVVNSQAPVAMPGIKSNLTTINVQVQSGVSTAAQIKTALDSFPAAAALIATTVTTSGAMESGLFVQLSGGTSLIDIESAASALRMRVNITAGTGTVQGYISTKS